MLIIIILLAALAGCLLGMKKGFMFAWILFFNAILSIYLSIMLTAMTGKYLPDSVPNQWAKAGELLFIMVFLFIILQFISYHLFAHLPFPGFPKYFELIGSGLFGLLGGCFVVWFLIYVVCITPFGASYIEKNQSHTLENARKRLSTVCGLVEGLSLQEDDRQSGKIYFWLETPKAKFVSSKQKPNQSNKTKSTSNVSKNDNPKNISVTNSEPNDPNIPTSKSIQPFNGN